MYATFLIYLLVILVALVGEFNTPLKLKLLNLVNITLNLLLFLALADILSKLTFDEFITGCVAYLLLNLLITTHLHLKKLLPIFFIKESKTLGVGVTYFIMALFLPSLAIKTFSAYIKEKFED